MRVRAFLALALIALVVLSASACNSGGGSADSTGQTQQSTRQTQQAQTLSVRDFKNKVAAEVITGSDYQADPGFGPLVDVSDPNGLNTLQIVVTDAYNDYRAHPERQQEIVQKLVDDSVSQLDEGNSKRGFAEVRDQLMPLLKRSSAVEGVDPAPALSPFHELDVAYGVQRDHSFALVTKDDLRRWNRSRTNARSSSVSRRAVRSCAAGLPATATTRRACSCPGCGARSSSSSAGRQCTPCRSRACSSPSRATMRT
jgi:hypothetical protein